MLAGRCGWLAQCTPMPGSGRRRDDDSLRGDCASVSWGSAREGRLDEKIEMFTALYCTAPEGCGCFAGAVFHVYALIRDYRRRWSFGWSSGGLRLQLSGF